MAMGKENSDSVMSTEEEEEEEEEETKEQVPQQHNGDNVEGERSVNSRQSSSHSGRKFRMDKVARITEKRVVVTMDDHESEKGGEKDKHEYDGGDDGDDESRDGEEENDHRQRQSRGQTKDKHTSKIQPLITSSATMQLLSLSESESGCSRQELLMRLMAEGERVRQFLTDREEAIQRETQHIDQLHKECKALKEILKRYKARKRERKRIRRLMHGKHNSSDDDDDADDQERGSRRHRRKGSSRKTRRRFKRFQNEISLRFQLMQSESQRFEMHVEKQLQDLRREYTESYLFANPFPAV